MKTLKKIMTSDLRCVLRLFFALTLVCIFVGSSAAQTQNSKKSAKEKMAEKKMAEEELAKEKLVKEELAKEKGIRIDRSPFSKKPELDKVVMTIPPNDFQQDNSKVALLIGNANYSGQNALGSPVLDVRLMNESLKEMGYSVTLVENATRETLRLTFIDFFSKSASAKTTYFYYSGHMVKLNEKNYLVPVDAKLVNEKDVAGEAIDLDMYIDFMDPNRENIISIDACYSNRYPFNFSEEDQEDCFVAPDHLPKNTFVTFTVASNFGSEFYLSRAKDNSLFSNIFSSELKVSRNKYSSFVNAQKSIKEISRGKQGLTVFGTVSEHTDWKFNKLPIIIFSKMKAFSWPPPKASAIVNLPQSIFQNCVTLEDANRRLCQALDNSGYFDKSYYSVEQDAMKGFAIATKLEKINADGTSKNEKEWGTGPDDFSFGAFFTSLFFPHTGYFRVIVFVVIDTPFIQSNEGVTSDTALGWLRGGSNDLTDDVGDLPFTAKHRVTALIYEYKLPENDVSASLADPSAHQGRDHLVKSRIWNQLTGN